MSTLRKFHSCLRCLLLTDFVCARFNFGPDLSNDNQSFVQLVSTTDPAAAWPDFFASRKATLAQLPPTIDPKTLVAISNGGTSDSVAGADAVPSTTTTGVSAPTAARAGGPTVRCTSSIDPRREVNP